MRKRSKYKPVAKLVNPLAYAIESVTPVANRGDDYAVDLKIKVHAAMLRLTKLDATPADMHTLATACDISKALYLLGIGGDYLDIVISARDSIIDIINRSQDKWKFIPAGDEIHALESLLELHDAQLNIATVVDMERAIKLLQNNSDSSLVTQVCNKLASSKIT